MEFYGVNLVWELRWDWDVIWSFVIYNLQFVIGNRKLAIDNKQLVIGIKQLMIDSRQEVKWKILVDKGNWTEQSV